jgi:hypothetical protein
VKVRKFGKNIVLSCSSLHLCRDASGVSRVKVKKFGKNIVIPDGSLRQSSRKDQWNCYCDLQASLHQMCVMRWANGAILLKRLVHLSSTEHLVVLAEKKSLWTVSVREPNLGVSSILFPWIPLLMSSTISMC